MPCHTIVLKTCFIIMLYVYCPCNCHHQCGINENIFFLISAIPLVTLFLCLIYAIVFQFEDVHETHCRVFNIIPSISAITGISPQRYFWRISVAVHIGPRFGLIACYRSHYNGILEKIQDEIIKKRARLLATVVFWSHTIELSALCGVTYVSNRENYRKL